MGILTYRGNKKAAVALVIFGILPTFLPGIAGLIALDKPPKKEDVHMGKLELALSIVLGIVYFAMMVIGIMAVVGAYGGDFGVFFGAERHSAEARAYTKLFGVLLAIMTPTLLMYFATANVRVGKLGKISMFVIGALAVFGLSFLYTELLGTYEAELDNGLADSIKLFAIRVAPFLGLIGYAFVCLAPYVIKPDSKNKFMRIVGRVTGFSVFRVCGALLFTAFIMPLSIGIMFILFGLLVIYLILFIVNTVRGDGPSFGRRRKEEEPVYKVLNEYGSELQLTRWGYCRLDASEVSYHAVYRDNLGDFWISDDDGTTFYRHPTGEYIVCNR